MYCVAYVDSTGIRSENYSQRGTTYKLSTDNGWTKIKFGFV